MALTAVLTEDPTIREQVREALDPIWQDVMACPGWPAVSRAVRERPVGVLLVDARCWSPGHEVRSLQGFWARFPSIPVGVVATGRDPLTLFELGRVGLRHLLVLEECGPRAMARAVRELGQETLPAVVSRALAPLIGRDATKILRGGLELTHRCPGADAFAEVFGYCRPHLSRILGEAGLPSVGHLLGWARLLHAAHWLPDPGRSGESVGRQLEYANGSTFRRALRNYLSATPGQIVEGGGLRVALEALCRRAGIPEVVAPSRWVA
jgi:AraC-like DNA-binding protein